jgi:hypothetical protein
MTRTNVISSRTSVNLTRTSSIYTRTSVILTPMSMENDTFDCVNFLQSQCQFSSPESD